jgi:hypothetical protein
MTLPVGMSAIPDGMVPGLPANTVVLAAAGNPLKGM